MSEEAKAKAAEEAEKKEAEKKAASKKKKMSPAEKLKAENAELAEQLAEAHDKVLRISAETENFKKRLKKETDDRLKYSNQVVFEALLPVIDNLELALAHTGENVDADSLRQGVEITKKQLMETLGKYGLEVIEAKAGTKFDPKFHEGLMLDNSDEYDDNVITMVLQHGYKLFDRVVRPTKVKVNKK